MKTGIVLSLMAAASLAAAPNAAAAQDNAAVFKPAGQWSLDYGEDYCRLARSFSDGKDTLALAWERIQPGPFMRMILVSNAIKPYRTATQLGWHFTPDDPERKARYTTATTADGQAYFNLGQFSLKPFVPPAPGTPPAPYSRDDEQAAAKGLTGLVLADGLTAPVEIDTGPLQPAIAALQACADDLAKTWGLDPDKLKTEKSAAIPEGGGVGWLPSGTIQFGDFGKLAGGSNQVRLMVGADGKASGCFIHWATLDQTTNNKVCAALMSNARFTPAKDADGQPMPGFWVGSPMMLGPPMPGGRGGR